MLRRLRSFTRNFFRRDQMEQEMAEELRDHLERRVEDLVRAGASPEEARRKATIEFGAKEAYKEQCREARGLRLFDEIAQDLRYALRTLRSSPGFAAVAILSLALGIGANTAVFSVLNALMFKSLPVARPGDLFLARPSGILGRFSYPAFQSFRDAVPAGPSIAAMSNHVVRFSAAFQGEQQTEAVRGQLVSGEYFSTLGVRPSMGRLLTPDDNRNPDAHPVVVISDRYWQRRFGASRAALGERIKLNGIPLTIVGVGPPGFSGVWVESPVDVWMPLMMQHSVRYMAHYSNDRGEPSQSWISQTQIAWIDIIARARPGERGRLQAALDTVWRPTVELYVQRLTDPQARQFALGVRMTLTPIGRGFSDIRQQFSVPLLVLMGMAAVVLLIACANLANLLLARSTARQREIAVRLSIGAGPARLMRQLLTESVLLSALGGTAGLVLARWINAFLVPMALGARAGGVPPAFALDLRVLAFAAAASLVTGVAFGALPAFRATRVDLNQALKATARSVDRGSATRAMRPLVALQVALSLVLLAGAGLFGRSMRNLSRLDPGFDRDHLLAVEIDARVAGYSPDQLPALYRLLTERLESIPGVRSTSLAECGLVSDCKSSSDGIHISGYQPHPLERVVLQENVVSYGYFGTVGIDLIAGREFNEQDSKHSADVAIINEAMVGRYFANRNPIGQRFGYEKPDTEIVGVVADARVTNVHDAAVPMAYYPLAQRVLFADLTVRVADDPRWIANEVRKVISEIDPNLPIDRVVPVSEQIGDSLSRDRLVTYLTGAFGGLALTLAGIGLYGVMSYTVARRTSELGIRMALGAPRGRVLRMVLRDSLILVGLGVAIGLPLAFVASRLLTKVLFGLTPGDPVTVVLATIALIAVAGFAGYLPAWRASRLDPLVALREE